MKKLWRKTLRSAQLRVWKESLSAVFVYRAIHGPLTSGFMYTFET
jgi:hypothetical protein